MVDSPSFETFADIIALEPHGPDVFVGQSPVYPWGRVYGGLVVAQAMQAAVGTVDPRYAPHSLHAYFIRGGSSDEPIRYEVDRIRNGRSFVTRRVVARQSNGAILNLSASFHIVEGEVDVAAHRLPDRIPHPDDLDHVGLLPLVDRRAVPSDAVAGRTAVWLRAEGPLVDEPIVHALALAYISDDAPFDAAASPHPDRGDLHDFDDAFVGASLDHSLWFHRYARADEWQLHVLEPDGFVGNRGLAMGQVFALDGTHIASVAQQILLRRNTRGSG